MKIRITESQLKRLINEQENNYLSRVEKIDPSILDLINTIRSSGLPETTILGQNDKIISWVPSPKDPTKGSFNIFKVIAEGGIPYIIYLGKITYRGDASDSKIDNKVGSQLFTDGKIPAVSSYGKTTLEQLNNIWSVRVNVSQQVLNIARQFVDRNKETFKKEFERVTRNQWAIKTLWGDNPQPKQNLAGSQYYAFFYNKLNPLPKVIVDMIQDDELVEHLTYKVKNFNSEGKYPNITPPVPQPVKPGSGYPLA